MLRVPPTVPSALGLGEVLPSEDSAELGLFSGILQAPNGSFGSVYTTRIPLSGWKGEHLGP